MDGSPRRGRHVRRGLPSERKLREGGTRLRALVSRHSLCNSQPKKLGRLLKDGLFSMPLRQLRQGGVSLE